MRSCRSILLLVSSLLVPWNSGATNSAVAGDWPQILGPHRTGVAENESLAASWSSSGPKSVWQRDSGTGFSGLAVSDSVAVLFHRVGNDEVVEAVNASTGKGIWSAKTKAQFVPSYTSDNGPRAVPIIHRGRVYSYGALGYLRANDLKTGKEIWARDTFKDYGPKRPFRGEPPEGYFGIASTPIIQGEKIIVNVGGSESDSGIVAFDIATGKTVWKATDERLSYSSPVAARLNGKQHVIFAARFNVVSVDPENGKVNFRFPFGTPGPNVTAASPVIIDGNLFITASYRFGAVFAAISENGTKELWSSDDILSSQYTTCIAHEGKLYGVHGRQDQGLAALRCIDPKNQKVLWEEDGFGYATLIAADKKLIILKTDGTLVLVGLDPSGYRELAKAKVLKTTTRALPALASGKLYIRDTSSTKCLDLSSSKK